MNPLIAVLSSRKFILFAMTICMADIGWIYCLIYKPDQLATVSTFLVTLLGAYAGANLTESYKNSKYGTASPAAAAPSSWYTLATSKPPETQNGPK